VKWSRFACRGAFRPDLRALVDGDLFKVIMTIDMIIQGKKLLAEFLAHDDGALVVGWHILNGQRIECTRGDLEAAERNVRSLVNQA
jgi:hypothetical protein